MILHLPSTAFPGRASLIPGTALSFDARSRRRSDPFDAVPSIPFLRRHEVGRIP